MGASALRKDTLSVSRPATGTYVEGVWSGGSATVFTIVCSVQTPKGEDMLVLPEGRRDRESYIIYTSTELKTVDVSGQYNPDIVTIRGETFEVAHVDKRQSGIINHYKVLVQKQVA